jgi:hypothetical protein
MLDDMTVKGTVAVETPTNMEPPKYEAGMMGTIQLRQKSMSPL